MSQWSGARAWPLWRWSLPALAFLSVSMLPVCVTHALSVSESAAQAAPMPVVVTGYLDTYDQYNFDRVPPSLRSFDVEHNAFSLSLANVALSKSVSPEGGVGFRTELAFGKTADLIAAYEPASDGKEITKHLLQAYASVLAGSKLQIDIGKFLSPLGAEVASALRIRPEYRGDFTNDAFFSDDEGQLKDSQHALLVGVVCSFAGKI
jgi:hypothetical protein